MGLLDAATRRRFEELKAQNSPRAALMLRVLDEHTVAEDQYFSEVRFFEEVLSDAAFDVGLAEGLGVAALRGRRHGGPCVSGAELSHTGGCALRRGQL